MSDNYIENTVIVDNGGCGCGSGCVGILLFGLAGLTVLVFSAVILVFLVFYALVSWMSNVMQGPDPEPSPSFWQRLNLWVNNNTDNDETL